MRSVRRTSLCVCAVDGQAGSSDCGCKSAGPATHSGVDLVLTRTKDTATAPAAALPHKYEGLLTALPVDDEGGSSNVLMMSADAAVVGRAHLELSGPEARAAVAVTGRLLGAGLLSQNWWHSHSKKKREGGADISPSKVEVEISR
jgi:hypothetical protein